MENNIKSIFTRFNNIFTLSIKLLEQEDISSYVNETCVKFNGLANILALGEYIGWEFNLGSFEGSTFSSGDIGTTAEDFYWVFNQCADIGNTSLNMDSNLFRSGRKIYALYIVRDEKEKISPTYDDEMIQFRMQEGIPQDTRIALIRNLTDIMRETETVVRIVGVGSKTVERQGMIFLSLPGKISLRMCAMIKLIFPYVEVREVNEILEEMPYLPKDNFNELMKEFLSALIYHLIREEQQKAKNEQDEGEGENGTVCAEEEVKTTKERDSIGLSTPLEKLELSVRAYNVLRREGVETYGDLKDLNDDDFVKMRNLGVKCIAEIKHKLRELKKDYKVNILSETNYMGKLDELIGLTEVKAQVKKIAAFAKMKKELSENGNISAVFNMTFTGNPGTAKTTVARIIAGIFYELGLIRNNGLIEVGRADLVASYEGQTAGKVKDVFNRAEGSVLFIDEAYSLVSCFNGGFGDEAINTIVQEMENNREDTIVIFAGYPDEMKKFFDRNPGLSSRVPFSIAFNDYSESELMEIVKMEAGKRGFEVDEAAEEKLYSLCTLAAGNLEMGNGRFCRNLVEDAVLNYAMRVYADEESGEEKNCILIADDFEFKAVEVKKKGVIGFVTD